MNAYDFWLGPNSSAGLLVDTNLLVLFTVRAVNRNRIESFKRTRKYTKGDYELLVRVLEQRLHQERHHHREIDLQAIGLLVHLAPGDTLGRRTGRERTVGDGQGRVDQLEGAFGFGAAVRGAGRGASERRLEG